MATALAAALGTGAAATAQEIAIREIGSFHVGGRIAALEGLPVQEIVFTAGAPSFRYDPNGQFRSSGWTSGVSVSPRRGPAIRCCSGTAAG